ncbi:MAG: hypothetical protein K8S98_10275 [Planctomycetes bacterium]|nr:hypothetical protein [Planctomycetota bacterium]
MFDPKPLSKEAVPAALEKARLYRSLNESMEAESICLDILAVEPDHRDARITLFLALTDQLEEDFGVTRARALDLVETLGDDYSRAYYRGILFERSAKARMRRANLGSSSAAHDDFRAAMASFERASELRPRGNDEAILRWNTCARHLNRRQDLQPPSDERDEHMLE